jgi:proteasome lid subunit RPN8/RPN11
MPRGRAGRKARAVRPDSPVESSCPLETSGDRLLERKAWTIPVAAYREMASRAEADYPEESCGFVFGVGDALEVVPMRNVQNDLHRQDPKGFPRDARTAYYFDPTEMKEVLERKEAAGVPLRAIYHSHPDHDAYFSDTDGAAAAPLGEPSFPGVIYLVFSVQGGRVRELKGFDWSAEHERYVEVAVRVGPESP